jgi:hypothetical protein
MLGDLAQLAQLSRFQRAVRQQGLDNSPLLFRNAVLVQDRPELRHQRFACLQHQLRQIAVTHCGRHALYLAGCWPGVR